MRIRILIASLMVAVSAFSWPLSADPQVSKAKESNRSSPSSMPTTEPSEKEVFRKTTGAQVVRVVAETRSVEEAKSLAIEAYKGIPGAAPLRPDRLPLGLDILHVERLSGEKWILAGRVKEFLYRDYDTGKKEVKTILDAQVSERCIYLLRREWPGLIYSRFFIENQGDPKVGEVNLVARIDELERASINITEGSLIVSPDGTVVVRILDSTKPAASREILFTQNKANPVKWEMRIEPKSIKRD